MEKITPQNPEINEQSGGPAQSPESNPAALLIIEQDPGGPPPENPTEHQEPETESENQAVYSKTRKKKSADRSYQGVFYRRRSLKQVSSETRAAAYSSRLRRAFIEAKKRAKMDVEAKQRAKENKIIDLAFQEGNISQRLARQRLDVIHTDARRVLRGLIKKGRLRAMGEGRKKIYTQAN